MVLTYFAVVRIQGPPLRNQSTELGKRTVPWDGLQIFAPDYDHSANTPAKWILNVDIHLHSK